VGPPRRDGPTSAQGVRARPARRHRCAAREDRRPTTTRWPWRPRCT